MENKREQINAVMLWSESFINIKSRVKTLSQIGLYFFILPSVATSFLYAYLSKPIADNIHFSVTEIIKNNTSIDLQTIIAPASNFFLLYLILSFLLILSIGSTYVSISKIFIKDIIDSDTYTINIKDTMLASLKFLFPKGIIIIILLFIVSSEQSFIAPFRVFTLMSSLMLIFILKDKTTVFRSFWDALLLRYISKKFSFFSTFITFLTTAIVIYFFEQIVAYVVYFTLHLDEILGITNTLWSYQLPGFACTLMYLITQIFLIVAYYCLLVFISCFSACAYKKLRQPLSEKL
jgi:hypothetical protein